MCDLQTQVLSDAETQPNQEQMLTDDDNLIWGRLFPVNSPFKAFGNYKLFKNNSN